MVNKDQWFNQQAEETRDLTGYQDLVTCLHYRIATNLKSLLNYWITNGGMPQVHATAKNFFIYKDTPKPEGNTIDELRPISATSYFFKLLEIILKDRIERGFRTGMIKPLN
jgi:hypothetical protein